LAGLTNYVNLAYQSWMSNNVCKYLYNKQETNINTVIVVIDVSIMYVCKPKNVNL